MANTSHGQHIPGTSYRPPPEKIAKCGGIRVCITCSEDARIFMMQQQLIPIPPIVVENPQVKALRLVREYLDRVQGGQGLQLEAYEVVIVWFAKTLQNWKAIVATDVIGDGKMFEVTYDGDQSTTYLCAYKKTENISIPDY